MQQPGTYMKKNTSKRKPQGKAASHAYALLAKAESAEKIAIATIFTWPPPPGGAIQQHT